MDPKEFYIVAEKLIENPTPANTRTAINRAYYAAYNLGVNTLNDLGFSIPTGPAGHGAVQKQLNNSGNSKITRIGNQITSIYSERIQADYRLKNNKIENPKNAQAIVAQVKRIIEIIDTECYGPNREEIQEGIKAYLEKTNQG